MIHKDVYAYKEQISAKKRINRNRVRESQERVFIYVYVYIY